MIYENNKEHHKMKKIQRLYPDKEILYDSKAFAGIGHGALYHD